MATPFAELQVFVTSKDDGTLMQARDEDHHCDGAYGNLSDLLDAIEVAFVEEDVTELRVCKGGSCLDPSK